MKRNIFITIIILVVLAVVIYLVLNMSGKTNLFNISDGIKVNVEGQMKAGEDSNSTSILQPPALPN